MTTDEPLAAARAKARTGRHLGIHTRPGRRPIGEVAKTKAERAAQAQQIRDERVRDLALVRELLARAGLLGELQQRAARPQDWGGKSHPALAPATVLVSTEGMTREELAAHEGLPPESIVMPGDPGYDDWE